MAKKAEVFPCWSSPGRIEELEAPKKFNLEQEKYFKKYHISYNIQKAFNQFFDFFETSEHEISLVLQKSFSFSFTW